MSVDQATVDRLVADRKAYDMRWLGECADALRQGQTFDHRDLLVLWETVGGEGPIPSADSLVTACLEAITLYHITERLKS